MTAHELTTAYQRLYNRIEAILTPDQLALYYAYYKRLMDEPTTPTAEEQAVLAIIHADRQVARLDGQLETFLRATKLP